MTRHSVLAAAAAAALAMVSACGNGDPEETAKSRSHLLVYYSREGGIRFQASSLAVSTKGVALIKSEGCTARFRLSAVSWRRLRQALKETNLSALAGAYPAPAGAADVISETIAVGHDTVRIGDFSSLPPRAREELGPLVGTLGEVLAESEGRCTRSAGMGVESRREDSP